MPDEPPVVVVNPPADPPVPPAPPAVIVEPPAGGNIEEEEELDFVAEMVAQESIVREEQHEELLEAIAQWEIRLQELLRLQGQENPMLTEIRQQIVMLQNQIEQMRASMASPPPNQTPSGSTKTGTGEEWEDSRKGTKGSESPPPEAVPPPAPSSEPRKPRFRKL